MTKNEGLTVTVFDESGNIVGRTYSKRAKGLVKKSRAQYISDNSIRLNNTDPTYDITEESKMENIENNNNLTEESASQKNYVFFKPREWQKHPDVPDSVADRFFINSVFEDRLTEVYSLGNWGWQWSEITNGMLMLQKNTEYHFVFWLNGGENDNSNEVCQCVIAFGENSLGISTSEWNNRLIFKLNRNFLKPLKRYKGWELYDIPFTTKDNDYTQIRFVAQYAPMTIMAAREPEQYAGLEEIVDAFANRRPQRHNIVFEDGWPTNKWYATARLQQADLSGNGEIASGQAENTGMKFLNIGGLDFDLSVIADRIAEQIDLDEIIDEIVDDVDYDFLKEQLVGMLSAQLGK